MNRRNFLGNLFAAGVVAMAPRSILSLENNVVKETVGMQSVDFGKSNIILIYNNHIVATSKNGDVIPHQEIIEITGWEDNYKEFLPGEKSYSIKMPRVRQTKQGSKSLVQLMKEGTELQMLFEDDEKDRYSSACFIATIEYDSMVGERTETNIELQSSGTLTKLN